MVSMTRQRNDPKDRQARPLSPGAVALARMLARAWSLPPQRNRVMVARDVQVPMSDGTMLLADHYLPVSVASAATVLVRCPYGRTGPFALQCAQILAERGYHVLLQSVRGTFGSGGDFEPMRHEISDGHDTVAWLREQDWFEGPAAGRPVLGAAAVPCRAGPDHGPGAGGGRLARPVHRADPRAVPDARRPRRDDPPAGGALGPPGHHVPGRRRGQREPGLARPLRRAGPEGPDGAPPGHSRRALGARLGRRPGCGGVARGR